MLVYSRLKDGFMNIEGKSVVEFLDEISKKEISSMRERYGNNFKEYLLSVSKKILRKLINSYFDFAILQNCIIDLHENEEFDNKKIDLIFCKLQKIRVYMDEVLRELNEMAVEIKSI